MLEICQQVLQDDEWEVELCGTAGVVVILHGLADVSWHVLGDEDAIRVVCHPGIGIGAEAAEGLCQCGHGVHDGGVDEDFLVVEDIGGIQRQR